jgi:hypothetical protein
MIDIDTVQEVKIVSDEYLSTSLRSPCLDLLTQYIDRIDIKTRVDFIQDDHFWIEQGSLEELYTTLFSSRKSNKELSIEDGRFESKVWQHLLDHPSPDKWSWWFFVDIVSKKVSIIDSTEVLTYLYTWDLWDILE